MIYLVSIEACLRHWVIKILNFALENGRYARAFKMEIYEIARNIFNFFKISLKETIIGKSILTYRNMIKFSVLTLDFHI